MDRYLVFLTPPCYERSNFAWKLILMEYLDFNSLVLRKMMKKKERYSELPWRP